MLHVRKSGARELFSHEVRRDGRIVVVLRGVDSGNGGVTVEAEVHPVRGAGEPQNRPFAFPSRDRATSFVDDALDALQYVGCTVAE